MSALYFTLASFGVLYGVWYIYEHFWDRRLFRHRNASDFVTNVRAGKAAILLREEGLLPIDVRSPAQYTGEHLPGAINAPFLGTVLDPSALDGIDRSRPLLVYCDGGYRSRQSLPALRAAGFTSIYHLHRGLMSWKIAKEATDSGPPENRFIE